MIGPLKNFLGGAAAAVADSHVRVLLGLTTISICIASTFYRYVESWSWLDSIYFSVITIATVGYGDFSPQTAPGKIFTIFYVVFGLGLFVATATAIADRILVRSESRDKE